jgi:glycosyltransferase involved in cell wall biosynthesis
MAKLNKTDFKKLVVLIPAYNEEEFIGKTILDIPRKIDGVDSVKVLVIDDGSIDKTVDIATEAGADKIISLGKNMGVATAFMTGVRNAISMNADILVTIDGDGQFPPKQISEIVVPIVNSQYDMVSGARFTREVPKDYPKLKLIGNKLFSKMVSLVVGQTFVDTQTGFRAYSKNAMLNISIISEYNFAQEVIIDLVFKGFSIGEIPVKVLFDKNRKSRIVRNIFSYSSKAMSTIIRSVFFHRPLIAFGGFGAFLCSGGILAKLLTMSGILAFSDSLETGLIILGIVSFMMGLFANVVFKRQAFTEKDIRHYIEKFSKSNTQDSY